MTLEKIIKAQLIIARLALAMIVLVTLVDVLTKMFTGVPIRGVYDVVQACQVFVIFLALPEVFRSGANITVGLVDGFVGTRATSGLRVMAAMASAAFLLIILISAYPVAKDAFDFDEYMPDTGIRYWIVWIPVLYGIALSVIAALVQPLSISRQNHSSEVGQ